MTITIFLLLFGCTSKSNDDLDENIQTAIEYLEKRGYTVTSVNDRHKYILTNEMVNMLPGKRIWLIQDFNANEYIGKEVEEIYFKIKNHPFEEELQEKEVTVFVIMVNGEAIGGISIKPVNEGIVGSNGIYSLDGKKQ